MKEIEVAKSLLPFLKNHQTLVNLVLGFGFFAAITEGIGITLFIPLIQSSSENSLTTNGWLGEWLSRFSEMIPASNRTLVIAILIFVAILVRSLMVYARDIASSHLDARLSEELRQRVFDLLMKVRIDFLESRESSRIVNVINNETATASELLATILDVFVVMATIIILIVLMLLISSHMTFLVVCFLLAISILLRIITKKVELLSKVGIAADNALTRVLLETLRGARTIREFGTENFEQQRFVSASRRMKRSYLKMDLRTSLLEPLSSVLLGGLVLLVFVSMMGEPSQLPAVLMFMYVLTRLQPQVAGLDEARNQILESSAGIDLLLDTLKETNKQYLVSGAKEFHDLKTGIRFEHVSFRYESTDTPALTDVTFEIPANATTAIVGRSGAGKSSVINLVMRFYDPTAGEIFVDNQSLGCLLLDSWRHAIAIVHQQPYLFDESIRFNVGYGNNAADEEIVAAAKKADAHDFITSLPDGYDTIVGEQGVRLSGGQRQRLTLARAIAKYSQLLILDEATNALDGFSDHFIKKTLRELSADRTMIVIAHRMATIEEADHVIVLEDGRLVESGPPAQLLKNDAMFARLNELERSFSEAT